MSKRNKQGNDPSSDLESNDLLSETAPDTAPEVAPEPSFGAKIKDALTPAPKVEPAPAPAPLAKIEPAKTPEAPQAPSDGKPRIELRVFHKIHGAKPDQLAGFVAHAKAQKLGPLTVDEWRAAYAIFMGSPVK